jgi:branched-chain amino acid transport system ATP-binding protein
MNALLQVDDVSVAFGGLQALANVSVRVPEGDILGLIGPNGAGKTTLLNVISGLQPADNGTISYAGDDVTHLSTNRRAAMGIARGFQNLGLISDETVGTNLMAAQHLSSGYVGWDLLARPWRSRRAERRIRERARDTADAFGLSSYFDSRVTDLSFGVARFVELACVLIDDPRLILLDEPTTGLDAREVDELLMVLRSQSATGTTILLVAHDVRFVMELCDHVYVLASGRVLFDGEPNAVRQHPLVIEAYLGRTA